MENKDINKKKENGLDNFVNILENIYNKVSQVTEPPVDDNEEFIKNVTYAFEEWQGAESFFHSVSDPDLIDHAIYKVEATKSRYIYLLKQAKTMGIKMNFKEY